MNKDQKRSMKRKTKLVAKGVKKALRQKARRLGLSIGSDFFHAAQCGLCPICGDPIVEDEPTGYDHVWPLNAPDGKRNLHQGNLLLVHTRCNRAKDNRLPTNGEISILAMVNDILGFDEATGQYHRRAGYLSALEVSRCGLIEKLQELQDKIAKADREAHILELYTLQSLNAQIIVVDEMIADQRKVFETYRFLYDGS